MKEPIQGDEELVFNLISIQGEDDEEVEEVIGEVVMPKNILDKAEQRCFEGPLRLIKVNPEASFDMAADEKVEEMWGELMGKIEEEAGPVAPVATTSLAPPEPSRPPGSAGSEQ